MKHPHNILAPWSLHFDQDGTEDIAIICDSNMHDLATSRFFWRPEDEEDSISPTLAAFWLMVEAPALLDATCLLLKHTIERKLKQGLRLTKGEQIAHSKMIEVINRINGGKQ